MRIVVTGASGFIGREVLDLLRKNHDNEIVALSRSEKSCDENITWIATDYSIEHLAEIFESVDAVIHLAGTKGGNKTLEDFAGDIEMMENILEAMRKCDVKKIIFTSSRLVYGNPDNIPWKENSSLEPKLAYGECKVKCENLCKKYAEKYGFKYVILRLAQVLGIGEGTKTMINVFQDLAKDKKQLKVIGKSIAKRQYIYCGDIAELINRLAVENLRESITVNVGMENAYTNYEIAQMINKAFENDAGIDYDESQEETITSSIMEISYLINEIAYKPKDMFDSLLIMRDKIS